MERFAHGTERRRPASRPSYVRRMSDTARTTVTIVQRRFHPNTLGWVEGLRELGHNVRLILHTPPNARDPVTDVPIVRALPSTSATNVLERIMRPQHRRNVWVPSLRILWHELGRSRTDVVLLKQVRFASVVVALVALLRRTPRLAWTNDRARLQRWRWRLPRMTGILPRRLIWTSTGNVGAIVAEEGTRRGRFIPYAVPLPPTPDTSPSRRRAEPDQPVRVLTVGKFAAERKRTWWTLDAAVRAELLDGRATFTFVGAGHDNDRGATAIRRLAQATDRRDLVQLHYDVAYEDMSAIYRAHDILVLPSRDEPFGMVVLEAMAHGLAVVVSDTVGARCCVVPGRNGLVFPSDDIDALARCLHALIDDADATRRMGEESRTIAVQHAAPLACAQAILDLAGIR